MFIKATKTYKKYFALENKTLTLRLQFLRKSNMKQIIKIRQFKLEILYLFFLLHGLHVSIQRIRRYLPSETAVKMVRTRAMFVRLPEHNGVFRQQASQDSSEVGAASFSNFCL